MNLGYSPLSAIDRKIEPCPQYDKYFPKPKNGTPVKKLLTANGGVEDTVMQMIDIVNNNYTEVEKAKHLVKGANTYQTAKNIFDFLYKHIKYNLERGEILNTPAVSYYWGQVLARQNPDNTQAHPIDCDDFSIFAASFLKSLGLPWGFRIASYDGKNFSHVYCIVPGAQEIIIDPVYYYFNKEKPYKKQQTYIGSSGTINNLSGMNIYYQGVKGLSGLGYADRNDIYELAGLGNIQGLGDVESDNHDTALLGYLKENLRIAKQNPQLLKDTYKNPQQFSNMLDKAISAIGTEKEDEILAQLAAQEQQMILSGTHSLSGVSGDDEDWYVDEDYTGEEPELAGLEYEYDNEGNRYFTSLEGFFGRLRFLRKIRNRHRAKKYKRLMRKSPARAQRYKSRYQRRDKRRVARRKKVRRFLKNAGRFLTKVNPLAIVARNSLRALLALNFLGLSTKLKADPKAFSKLVSWYKSVGGKASVITNSVNKGARRKPLMKKRGKAQVSGLAGFGVIEDISSLAKTAGGIIKKIFQWLKERKQLKKVAKEKGITIKDARAQYKEGKIKLPEKPKKEHKFINKVKTFVKDNAAPAVQENYQPAQPVQQPYTPRENGYMVQTSPDRSFAPVKTQTSGNLKKIGIAIAGTAIIGGVAYAIWNYKDKEDKPAVKPKTGLSGTKFKKVKIK